MGKLLSLDKDHSISSVEAGLARLEGETLPVDLLLNTTVRHAQFGGLSALNQLVVTWAKRHPSGALRTYVNSKDEAKTQIENLVTYDHGLTALLMAGEVTDRTGNLSLKTESLLASRHRLMAMGTLKGATRGSKAFLATADHTGVYPESLYDISSSPNPEVRQWDGFRSLAQQMLLIATVGPEKQKPTNAVIDNFGTVLWELFKNTHDWARSGSDGNPLQRSIRALRIEHYSHMHEKHLEMTADEPRLNAYLLHPKMKRADGRSRMIEVSVLDSGPGLAARALRRNAAAHSAPSSYSISQEYAAVVDCLRTHFSTSAESHRGDGLHQVFLMLHALRGFVRIRTGRLAVCRDFVRDPYVPSHTAEPFLLDWQTGSIEPSEASAVEGTVITMLFPVAYD